MEISHGYGFDMREDVERCNDIGARARADGGEALDVAEFAVLEGEKGVCRSSNDPISARVVNLEFS
jgi:hypothetical protein